MSIHKLAQAGGIKNLRALLAKDSRAVKYIDKDKGWTALHYAAHNSKIKVVEILLDAGANVNAITKSERLSPMDIADGPKRKAIIKLLRSNGGHFSSMTLHNAVESADTDVIEEFLEDDSVKINERDGRGWMPLHYAVDYDELEITKLLLSHGANVNGGTLDSLNPMEIAKDNDNQELLKFLRSKGGQLNIYRGKDVKPKTETWIKPKAKDKKSTYDPNAMFPKQLPKKGLLSKLGDKLTGEDKRQQEEERRQQLAAKQLAAKQKKAEEDRLKRAPRISWKGGQDPFKCKASSLAYDYPCQGYIFFMDIVKYSAKSTAEQKQVSDELAAMVKATPEFKSANRAGKLIILPTGDGMGLGFFTNVHDAFTCALNVAKKVYKHPRIGLRMGVHFGSVVPIKDINDNPNISGDGINMAQRVMDAGDNDHLLVSNEVYGYISSMGGLTFEDYGPVYVKHGVAMHLHSVYGKNFGRKEFPSWRVKKV